MKALQENTSICKMEGFYFEASSLLADLESVISKQQHRTALCFMAGCHAATDITGNVASCLSNG